MSGLEVLGLILGIYPVIGNVLSIHRALKSGGAKRFFRILEVEQVIFSEFVHNLLASELSETDLALLRDGNPSELDIWKNKDLLSKVNRRLGPKTSELVLSTLHDINELLQKLREDVSKIAINEQGNFTGYSRFQGRLQTLKHNLPQSSVRQSLDELTACNGILQRLLCDRAIHLSVPPGGNAPQRTKYLRRDCSHAVDLYNALYGSFKCQCTHPHPANLAVYRLNYHNDGGKKRSLAEDDCQFELLFSSSLGEEDFEDADSVKTAWSPISGSESLENDGGGPQRRRMSSFSIQEYAGTASLDMQQSIDDLCSFVRSLEGNSTVAKASLSLLGPQEKNYIISMTPPRSNAGSPPAILCVHDFLTDNNWIICREDRMGLALRLSYAVLQFYSTPWISDNWTWRSFAFAKEGENAEGKNDTSQLFVARNFYSAAKLAEDSDSSDDSAQLALPYMWEEPILTRLGFALIELALGVSLADLRAMNLPEMRTLVQPNLNNAWMNAEILDRETARLLVDSGLIRREEGQAYEDAVRACLEHQYIHESDLRAVKSGTASFQEDVENCILAPLHDLWDKSWGNV